MLSTLSCKLKLLLQLPMIRSEVEHLQQQQRSTQKLFLNAVDLLNLALTRPGAC